jgi:lipopolysaccharide biosynthesis regulator YciM
MEKGVFDNAENFYNEIFHKASSNYEKTNAKFRLGKIYLHFKDTARAKEAFEYVVSHGNKLHIVEEANEYLKQMSK